MQFKTLVFLSILSVLFFTGCDSKDKKASNEDEKVEKIERKTEFTLTTIDNKPINIKLEDEKIILKDYPNKIVLLNFFATWCPPCKAEIPNLVKLQNDYKNDFVVVSVLLENNKTHEEIATFAKDYGINYIITNSNENNAIAKSLGGIKSIPTMFMIDKNSELFQKYVGIVPFEMMEIDIKKLLEK